MSRSRNRRAKGDSSAPQRHDPITCPLERRCDEIRAALVALVAAHPPGHRKVLRELPRLQAELGWIGAEILAARAREAESLVGTEREPKKAAQIEARAEWLRKSARRATADAIKAQAEARRSLELDLADAVDRLEQEMRGGAGFAESMREI